MSVDITEIGVQKVKSVSSGESVELKNFWEDQNVAFIFFRRWGCMLCRLWAKELAEIAPVLKKHNIKLIGVGVEEIGSKEFADGKFFDGDLYFVENISTYRLLNFKRFNVVTIITSLFWKQSRDAIFKGRGMGLYSDLIGDGLENGGALLVRNGGKIIHHFVQLGPADRMPNMDILEVVTTTSPTQDPEGTEGMKSFYLGLGGDLKGDWVQTGGALLVEKGGKLLHHFVQTGPGDHLPNLEILKHFGLESEYVPETMANKPAEEKECTTEAKSEKAEHA